MHRRTPASLIAASSLVVIALAAPPARAGDLGDVRLDVTSTTHANYHWDNRNDRNPSDVYNHIDDNYGEILEQLNVALAWKSLQAGLRWDTATYFDRPTASQFSDPATQLTAGKALAFRYRDQYLDPVGSQKIYVTFSRPWLEATVGDAYVSFGRGLVLSVRKIDELAADTSVTGGKFVLRLPTSVPLNLTGVVGYSNPVRIDEATAEALRDPKFADPSDAFHVWSRDLIGGGRIETRLAGATLGVHAADVHRDLDLSSTTADPTIRSKDVLSYGASLAIPRIAEALPINVFAEAAVQNLTPWDARAATTNGQAFYLSASGTAGIVTTTFEGKWYRGFYPVHLNVDTTNLGAYNVVQYNAPPTAELITQDSLFDDSCVAGGRLRFDVKPRKNFFFFASGAYFANWGELSSTACTQSSSGTAGFPSGAHNDTFDGYVGIDLRAPKDASFLIVTAGVRDDHTVGGYSPTPGLPIEPGGTPVNGTFYHEGWIEADGQWVVNPNLSLEVDTWHRDRTEATTGETWREGQTYLNVKVTPKYVFYLGHEYTTRPSIVRSTASLVANGCTTNCSTFLVDGGTQHYLNVGAQLKIADAVQVRLFAGEQRAALKCVSGVCRFFPAFEGVRTELVLRY